MAEQEPKNALKELPSEAPSSPSDPPKADAVHLALALLLGDLAHKTMDPAIHSRAIELLHEL